MNKTTDHFKRTIQAYLDNLAAEDKLFAASYNKPNKSIDDCVTYILNWVQKSGCNGFTDGEIYSVKSIPKPSTTMTRTTSKWVSPCNAK